MIIYNVTNYKGVYNNKEYEKYILMYGDANHYPRTVSLSPADYTAMCIARNADTLEGVEFERVLYTQAYGGKLKAVGIL